ncbi:MAG: hypothetical protein CVU57_14860 [Deltaproteobacteria bacterium HGW-Deltaproteobacteria-15]|nr:MAG: hypothetical protein CVU57_14860 [Deltaproteobacteria bacterium HGW-Deltaproteobacteria-15]
MRPLLQSAGGGIMTIGLRGSGAIAKVAWSQKEFGNAFQCDVEIPALRTRSEQPSMVTVT